MKVDEAVRVGDGVWRSQEKVFPYEFRMFSSRSEDEFFDRLTERLTLSESTEVSPHHLFRSPEALKVSGGSPQSILGGIGSWSGNSSNGSNHNSPPATPFETQDDTLGLMYAAAGQVARLKMNVEDPFEGYVKGQWRVVAKPTLNQKAAFRADQQMNHQNYIAAVMQAKEAALIWEHHLQNIKRSGTYCKPRHGGGSEILNQSTWPPLQQGSVPGKPNFQKVPLMRKESAGTGVFIPRRYDAADTPRKQTVISKPCALVPAKVVQALNTSFETMSACSRPQCVPNASSLSQQSYDALMARRHALLDQKQKSMVRTDDIASRSLEACLPQEWSY